MWRIPTLLEVGRRHILNALHLRGNNRSLTAKVLGLSGRGLGIKPPQREEAGFAAPVSLAGDEGSKVNAAGQDLAVHETATVNVIEELISLVEAIGERRRPGDDDAGQLNRRKEKT